MGEYPSENRTDHNASKRVSDSATFPGCPLRQPNPYRSFFFKTGPRRLAMLADMLPIGAEVSYIEIEMSDASKSRVLGADVRLGVPFHLASITVL